MRIVGYSFCPVPHFCIVLKIFHTYSCMISVHESSVYVRTVGYSVCSVPDFCIVLGRRGFKNSHTCSCIISVHESSVHVRIVSYSVCSVLDFCIVSEIFHICSWEGLTCKQARGCVCILGSLAEGQQRPGLLTIFDCRQRLVCWV